MRSARQRQGLLADHPVFAFHRVVAGDRLAALAQQTNAAAIYLMDARGTTLSASNWDRPDSFIGSNYGFRDYFAGALRDGTHTEFALGTVSRRPGLYLAERVGPASAPLGVVAVKVEFDSLERKWRDAEAGVFVTDAAGRVLWRATYAPFGAATIESRDLTLNLRLHVFFTLASRVGSLSVVAVLTALYPLGTIILARIFLKEKIAKTQLVGILLALSASALLAVA
mgnify:CR=1 FL=1